MCSGGSKYSEEWRKIRFGGEFLDSMSERVMTLDNDEEDQEARLPTNAVTTSKYTPWNFLCKNTYEQLQRFANLWFLILSVLMWIGYNTEYFPGLINPWPTLGTLMIMMAITAVSNAMDDCSRCHADNDMNENSFSQVLTSDPTGMLEERMWKDIAVGDVVYLHSGDQIPVDMVCIASAGLDGLCFVSTANLDGETNLKPKHAIEEAQDFFMPGNSGCDANSVLQKLQSLTDDHSFIKAEPPSADIRDFSGTFCLNGNEKGITFENMLLRGTVLRNVAWCIGVTIYTGAQTRIMKNSQPTPLKSPTLDSNINVAVGIIICIQLILGLISMIGRQTTREEFAQYWYLQPPRTMILPTWLGEWLAFFLLYSNLVPVSLFATIEACNVFQSKFIDNDKKMYDPEMKLFAKARSRNLCQEPGQVDYIFSDKTGTLTQNVMDLKQLSIAGKVYGTVSQEKGFNGGDELREGLKGGNKEAIMGFLECLAVAHTVIVDQDGRYEAESPDEAALVEAVGEMGYRLKNRQGHDLIVEVNDKDESYNILCTNAFDSKRKRMSTLVKKGSEYQLLIKGADNVMLALAKGSHQELVEHLHHFSCEGLRTLVLGRRKLSSSEANRFIQQYEEAYKSTDRSAALDAVAEQMEQDIEILGATAIEDKLQDGVGETIEKIRRAGIKLWVLTGDKLETARNIGFSCRVLTHTMKIEVLENVDGKDDSILDQLISEASELREDIEAWEEGQSEHPPEQTDVAMMVTGKALADVFEYEFEEKFLELAQLCSVVIACRVSPAQKAEMVALVRDKVALDHRRHPITLAIGDGANDVPMIQTAKIGIGIYGKEGMQAVNNSDIAIAQFQFLQRLLFVHGHWNYIRAAKVVLFTFWRNAALVLSMFYYTFSTGHTAIPLFEDMVRGTFNVFTFVPTICTGIFDRDQEAELVLNTPKLYESGRLNKLLDVKEILETMFSAFVHSMVLLMVVRFAYAGLDMVEIGDVWTFGTIVFTCLMVAVNYRLILITEAWNWIFWVGILVGFVLPYICFLTVYCSIPNWDIMNLIPMYGVSYKMAEQPLFWICLLTVPALAATMDLSKRFLWHTKMCRDHEVDMAVLEGKRSMQRDSRMQQTKAHRDPRIGSGFNFDHSELHRHPKTVGQTQTRGFEPGSETDEKTPLSRGYKSQPRPVHDDAYDEEEDEEGCRGFFSQIVQQEVPITWNCMTRDEEFCNGLLRCNPWRCSAACTFCMFLFLSLSGASIIWSSHSLHQVRIIYDGQDAPQPYWQTALAPLIGDDVDETQEHFCPVQPTPMPCQISVPIPEDIESPVLVYYRLNEFFQNFADYFQSISWKELIGGDVEGNAKYLKACKAESSRMTPEGGRISPCGMQANAFFNDTFEIDGMDETKIAWQSDVERFKNPEGYPEPDSSLWLYDRFPTVVNEADGVKNQHFGVWIRPDAYSDVRKPYGYIYRTLKKGSVLNITIVPRYPLANIGTGGVRKELVLTSYSKYVGGKDNSFGWFQVFFAAVCLVTCLCILCVEWIDYSRDDDRDMDEDASATSSILKEESDDESAIS